MAKKRKLEDILEQRQQARQNTSNIGNTRTISTGLPTTRQNIAIPRSTVNEVQQLAQKLYNRSSNLSTDQQNRLNSVVQNYSQTNTTQKDLSEQQKNRLSSIAQASQNVNKNDRFGLVKEQGKDFNLNKELSYEDAKEIAKLSGNDRMKKLNQVSKTEEQRKKNEQLVKQIVMNDMVEQRADKLNVTMQSGNTAEKVMATAGKLSLDFAKGAFFSVGDAYSTINSLLPDTKRDVWSGQIKEGANKEQVQAYKNVKDALSQENAMLESDLLKIGGNVSQTLGGMLIPGAVGSLAGISGTAKIAQLASRVTSGIQSGTGAYIDTLNENQDNKLQALATGGLKGLITYKIEGLTGGNFMGKAKDTGTSKSVQVISKLKNETVKKLVSKFKDTVGEVGEENLENVLGHIVDLVLGNDELPTIDQFIQETLETTRDTALTTLVLGFLGLGGETYNEVKMFEQNQAPTIENKPISNQTQQTIQQEGKIDEKAISQQPLGNDKYSIKMPNSNFKFEKTGDINNDNLDSDMSKYFNNSSETQKLNKTLKTIMKDKGIAIRFDENVSDANGNIVDGKYENGTITINPNSSKAFEYVTTHELTHAIGTKQMLDMVQKYRQSNKEFNSKVETLLQNYNATELTEEALADVSAELFGTQEFIANVKNTNPNLFQKIYNEIKYLWHQFRGYKNQNQFVEDLYNKWTQAYNSNAELNQTEKYFIAGKKAQTANRSLLKEAVLSMDKKTPEQIWKDTGWALGDDGYWRFEIDDSKFEVVPKTINENDTYSLKEFFNAKELYEAYPELEDIQIYFKDKDINKRAKVNLAIDENGDVDIKNTSIEINSKLIVDGNDEFYKKFNIKNQNKIRYELLHEVQHLIQGIEGFDGGASVGEWAEILDELYNRSERLFKELEYLKNNQNIDEGEVKVINQMIADNEKKIYELESATKVTQQDIRKMAGILYNQTPGEEEARSVAEDRSWMDSEERQNTLPYIANKNAKRIEDYRKSRYNIVNDEGGDLIESNKSDVINNRKYIDDKSNGARRSIGANSTNKGRTIQNRQTSRLSSATTQRKDTDNLSKSKNISTKGLEEASSFSMQKDNKGRQLTKQQENYLKDTKVRDKNGNIKTVYHGTPNDFTIFNYDKLGTNTSSLGAGFYFTDNESTGKEYSRGNGYVKEVYLDIKKPMKYRETTITKNEFKKFVEAVNQETEGRLVEDYGSLEDILMEYDYGGDDIDLVNSIHNASGLSWEKTFEVLRDSIGYDGLIEENFLNKGETIYVAFNSNQIKNVDNTNPTKNPDIRYSKQGNIEWYDYVEKQFKTEGTRTYGKDIRAEQPKKISEVFKKNVLLDNTIKSKKYTGKKQTNNEIAKILDTPKERQKPEDRKWAILKANILDKGIVFEDLSKKAKNRELEAKWDYTLSSGARGQYAIGNARYEEVNGKRTKIAKGLTEIIDEVGDKVSDFQNYMYHQLNVDRMSLEKNAKAEMERMKANELFNYDDVVIRNLARKRITDKLTPERKQLILDAKQYVALSEVQNKPVFGKGVTEFHSKNKVAEFEKNNPQFKEWAKDVYDYLKADKMELVKNGVISEELSSKFEQLYPHYVPIQRVDKNGNAISVPLDTRRTGINTPIKEAKGGNSDIGPLFQTMANRTMQTYRASARNSLGLELRKTLQQLNNYNGTDTKADLDNIIESMENESENNTLLQASSNGRLPTFTVFENGNKVTFDISEDIYDALKPKDSSSLTSRTFKLPNAISNIRRGVLTEYNPIFSITNTLKDTQDVLLNSQHPLKTYKKYPEAYQQIVQKGYWYEEYMQNGGEQNSYFKEGDFVQKEDSKVKSAIKIPFEKISEINGVMEMAPRLAEYIASRESGRSIQTSMLDASRVTTNFKAGGDVTKFLNRNGATFLNAGVQGTMQVVRNFREANMQGAKGYAILASKLAVMGLPVLILNNLIWDDDEEYDELQDYVKDSYYIVGKTKDGNFIRIPKGRFVASVQKIVSNVNDYLNNKKELNIDNVSKDLWESLGFAFENMAPNNPIENNVASPIFQVANNTSWYGEDIVPERLQSVPKAEQYDETTDAFSIWLGDKLNVSPMKINYLLDQYGGGVADILLPMGTKQAENNVIEDKFTTNPTMKSKYPGEFFEKSDEIEVQSNSMNATDEDIVKNKYMADISGEMSKLYKEKRKIQNSDATDESKKEQLEKVQEQINEFAKTGIEEMDKAKVNQYIAEVGDKAYYKDDEGKWKEIDKEKDLAEGLSLKTYADYKNKVAIATDKKRIEKNNDKATLSDSEKSQILLDSNYSEKEKRLMYPKYIGNEDKTYEYLSKITGNKVSIDQYLDYKTRADEFEADEDPRSNIKGKKIKGDSKRKINNYIINSNFSEIERLYIYGSQYELNAGDKSLFLQYVDNAKLDNDERNEILLKMKGTTEYKDGTITW